MRGIAAGPHEIGKRCLFKPGIAVAKQAFFSANGFGDMLGDHHIAEAQSAAQRFGKRPEIDSAIRRERGDR